MKEQLLSQLVNFVLAAVGILSSYALSQLGAFLNQNKQKVATEKGINNYNRALQIAKGMYLVLEDEFKSIEKAGVDKKSEMDTRLLQLIPELSKQELDSINKQIWNEFNENVVKVISTPVETVQPIQEVISQPVSQEVQDTIAELHNDEPTIEQPQA